MVYETSSSGESGLRRLSDDDKAAILRNHGRSPLAIASKKRRGIITMDRSCHAQLTVRPQAYR